MLHALGVQIGHPVVLHSGDGGLDHGVEAGQLFPGVLEHGVVVDGSGFGSQHMGHFQHGDFVALLRQIHAGLHADFAAADDDHIVAHSLRMDHGLGGNHDMGLVQTGDGGLAGRRPARR